MISFDVFNNSRESISKEISLKRYYFFLVLVILIVFIFISCFSIYISKPILYQIRNSKSIYLILDNKYKNIYINEINYNDQIITNSSKKNKYYVTIKTNGFKENERIKIRVEEETTIMKYLINYIRKDLFNETT